VDNGGAVESDVKGHFKAFMISSNSLQQEKMPNTSLLNKDIKIIVHITRKYYMLWIKKR